jgi:PBSX family phage terminase large subunit
MATIITSQYVPTPKQVKAHCAMEQFVGFGGAMGGGKTRWLCEMAKFLSIEFPGNFGLLARQSGVILDSTTMEVFFSEVLIPGSDEWKALGMIWNKTEKLLTFGALNPPSRIWFTGLDKDNTERIKSLNLGFFGVDEATEISEGTFMMLMTRLRRKAVSAKYPAGIPKEFRKGMISANPEAGWVKRRFLDQRLPNHIFIEADYKDNKYLPPEYAELFETMPQRWKDKYLYGNWEQVSGLVYKDFKADFHIIPPEKLGVGWKNIRGLDHGQQNQTACVGLAIAEFDRKGLYWLLGDRVDMIPEAFDHYPLLIVNALYYKKGLIHVHKKGIWERWEGIKTSGTHVDPSTRRRDRDKVISQPGETARYKEWSIFEEYLDKPYPILDLVTANNNVLIGIDRISTLLQIGHLFFLDLEELLPLTGPGGEIRNYEWKEAKRMEENAPEEPVKAGDHALDALRYATMSLEKPEVKMVPALSERSWKRVAERARKWREENRIAAGMVRMPNSGRKPIPMGRMS